MSDVLLQGYPNNLSAQQVTIAASASASEMISTQGRALVGILMPAAWTAADIAYKACLSGRAADLVQVYDSGGNPENTIAVAAHYIAFPTSDAIFVPYLQLVSVDTTDEVTPVAQGQDCTLILLFRNYLS